MNNDRCAIALCLAQNSFHGFDIVTVDGAKVFDVEVGVEILVVGEATQEAVDTATNTAIERTCIGAHLGKEATATEVQVAVSLTRADAVQEPGHATDGGSITAAIVVDNDDEVAGVVVADVIQRLPGHATRKCAISHNGNDMAV